MATVEKLRLRDFAARGEACHFAVTRAGWSTAAVHTHDFPEIFWIESGSGWHWINGTRRIARPRSLGVIRPEDHHGFGTDNSEHALVIANVAFPRSAWKTLQRAHHPDLHDLLLPEDFDRREFQLGTSEWASLLDASAEIRAGGRTALTLTRLLLNITYLVQTAVAPSEEMPAWLALACREIQRAENFSHGTKAFCRLAGRSPAHVARAARRYLSRTPTDLVNAARIHWAAEQLAATDRSIIDIALDCGLENLGHFYQLFRAARGISPHQYRIAQRRILRPMAN